MATQEKTWNVANRLHSLKDSDNQEVNHIIAGADEIYDDTKGAKQSDINAQTDAALADRYTKSETYSKEQLDSLITTPDVNYASVVATNATTAVTDILPATGEANTIYRVGNWNGTQYDPTMYALFAWNGTTYVCLAVRSFVGEVYDISVNHPDGQGNPTLYADLAAAIGTGGANIPADIRRGGMSIKFIQGNAQSSDNKYVQYFLTKKEWSVSAMDWLKLFDGRECYKLEGAGSTYVSTPIRLVKGCKYQIVFDNPSWARNDTGTDYSQYIFEIRSIVGNVSTNIFGFKRFQDTGTFRKSYTFDVPADSENITIGGRANVGTDIVFSLQDITEITKLSYEVDEIDSTHFYGEFVNGGLTNGELLPQIKQRISSKEILSYDREIEITAKSGFRFGIHFFENGVFVRDSRWQYSLKIQKGVTFKVVIARVTESESEVANIDEFLSSVYVTNIIDFVNTKAEAEPVYSSLGISESKIESPTRNGSNRNPSNSYAVVWLDIPCAGYKKICFRINKPFAASGNIFAFCYTLPDGTYRDNIAEDIQNGFYQDTQDKWLELSCVGLQTITIQAYETSLPSSYPDTFSPLRKEGFLPGQGLQYYFCDQTVNGLSAAIGELDSLSTTDKSDIVHAINEVDSNIKLTNKYNLFRVIEGKGQTFSDGYIYGLQHGQKYIFNLSKTSWDITGVVQGNYFAISNWYNGSHTALVQFFENFPQTDKIEFTVPQDSDFIAIGGRAAVGEKITGYITEDPPEVWVAEKMLVHKKMVSTYYGNQGLTIIGDTIIQFNSGIDDHSSYAAVKRWAKEDFTFIDGMTHNLGHAATVDYDSTIDALVVGNGTSDTSVAPRLDIVLGASAKFADGSPLNYNDADILHIELKTNEKEIGGSGLICCYGGNWREVFLATGQNAPRKFFRCLLGVGEEDFSDKTVEQNDVTSWGTFISGKTNTEYNGTLKVLATYTGEETQVYQGMCYRAGFIYLACGYSQPLVHKIRLYTNGRYEIVQTNIPQDYNADGSLKSVEPEGLCFYDETTMLVALPSYGGLFKIEAF